MVIQQQHFPLFLRLAAPTCLSGAAIGNYGLGRGSPMSQRARVARVFQDLPHAALGR
jgi:hypothetical protein